MEKNCVSGQQRKFFDYWSGLKNVIQSSKAHKNHQYPLEHSPLFRLKGKAKFEKTFHLEWDAVPRLLNTGTYRVWDTGSPGKKREIQAPQGWLAQVHKRIADLFSRIELPDYVFSRKGRSYADNARFHRGDTPLIKTDISRFYPSITRQMVFRMFVSDFECATDIAHRLADICCYQQSHLPTGSPLSGRIAFFACRHMFDEIATLAANSNCKMSSYVDDVTISGPAATKTLLSEIRQIIRTHGLQTRNHKSKTFPRGAAKTVTGAIIVRDEIRLPNARHEKILAARQALDSADSAERQHAHQVLQGRLNEAKQILGGDSPILEPVERP